MARGGHKRRIRVEDGRVTSHAPLNDETAMAEEWPVITVPENIPEHMNTLMGAAALGYDAEKETLTIDEDWKSKVEELHMPKPSRVDELEARTEALLDLLEEKEVVTRSEVTSKIAANELEGE